MTESLPSVYDESEEPYIDKEAQFYISSSQDNELKRSFRQLNFNDSVTIRLKHYSYFYYFFDRRSAWITISFLDVTGAYVAAFMIVPGDAELFHDYSFKVKTEECINQVTDITGFKHSIVKTYYVEAVLEMPPETARIPGNWRIVRPIQIGYKIIVRYYPAVKSIINIRLTDKNEIAALNVIIDYTTGILYTRRVWLDDENKQCVNFGSTQQFTTQMLGKVEIGVFSHQYKVAMGMNEIRSNNMKECMVYGHHLSPYDIQQTVFDSTDKTTVFYAYYIEPV
uniref:Bm10202, isoform a n=1 Tax=Brugia malayi TaxID=6279 RepID=A0A1I9G317_BRUMA|nr:Bm10202, isoform a [Brugia malayi]